MAASDDAPLVQIDRLTRRFNDVTAVDDISLDLAAGEFFALLGPSGCGKTTLMRAIAGFERPDAGRILLDGVDLADTPPHRRPVNMMFQSYALFPHMNVENNIAFGLRREGMARDDIARRVDEMLALVQLRDLRRRRPDQLSGGQRQRVALARALAKRPRLLLLDEPLAALDRKLREETQFELKNIQRQLGTTFMLVTHDQSEAMTMADRIGVMRAGRIQQLAKPREIYERPASRWIAGFIGEINLFEAAVLDSAAPGARCVVQLAAAPARINAIAPEALAKDQKVAIAVRPERLAVRAQDGDAPMSIAGEVLDCVFRGETTAMRVRLPSGFVVRATRANVGDAQDAPRGGARVALDIPTDAAVVLTR